MEKIIHFLDTKLLEHVNEIHMSVATSPPKLYVISLKTIDGGTSEDYIHHIVVIQFTLLYQHMLLFAIL